MVEKAQLPDDTGLELQMQYLLQYYPQYYLQYYKLLAAKESGEVAPQPAGDISEQLSAILAPPAPAPQVQQPQLPPQLAQPPRPAVRPVLASPRPLVAQPPLAAVTPARQPLAAVLPQALHANVRPVPAIQAQAPVLHGPAAYRPQLPASVQPIRSASAQALYGARAQEEPQRGTALHSPVQRAHVPVHGTVALQHPNMQSAASHSAAAPQHRGAPDSWNVNGWGGATWSGGPPPGAPAWGWGMGAPKGADTWGAPAWGKGAESAYGPGPYAGPPCGGCGYAYKGDPAAKGYGYPPYGGKGEAEKGKGPAGQTGAYGGDWGASWAAGQSTYGTSHGSHTPGNDRGAYPQGSSGHSNTYGSAPGADSAERNAFQRDRSGYGDQRATYGASPDGPGVYARGKSTEQNEGRNGDGRHANSGGECQVFVGGLDFAVTEEAVKERFEEIGRTVNVSIMRDKDTGRSKGYGFVEFSSTREADQAIERLNGIELSGRKLQVNHGKGSNTGRSSTPGGKTPVVVPPRNRARSRSR